MIKGWIKTSMLEWPGKITSVLFLGGCNLRCPWCHNPTLVEYAETLPDIPIQDIMVWLNAHHDWIDGVCISGGEPLYSPFTGWLCKELHIHGFPIKMFTNGTIHHPLKKLIEAGIVNSVSMDIKLGVDLDGYRHYICSNKHYLLESEIDYEFRITLVRGLFTYSEFITNVLTLQGAERLILQNYNTVPSMPTTVPYTNDELEELRNIAGRYVKTVTIQNPLGAHMT